MSAGQESTRSVPLLGDIPLQYVQRIRHSLDSGFVSSPVLGLAGELQQRSSRRSHRIRIHGVLLGEEAADQLATLQSAAADGEELDFAADITQALELTSVVITTFHAEELAGQPSCYRYEMSLAESPPLPEPVALEAFGGLDDFGLGDLGFDSDILGDLQDLAGDIAGAVNDALDVVGALAGLADLDLLSPDGLLAPLTGPLDATRELAGGFRDAADALLGDLQ